MNRKAPFFVAVIAVWPVSAASLRGNVKDEYFGIIREVSVTLVSEGAARGVQQTTTDREGSFAFLNLRRGSYTLRVYAPPFRTFIQSGIQIAEAQDLQVRRILLRIGESAGNCTPSMQARFRVKHSRTEDVEVAGAIGNATQTEVALVVFGDDRRTQYTTRIDDHGRFSFRVPASGDLRLEMQGFDVDVTTVAPGDRVIIEPIRPPFPKVDHWCY